MLQNFFNRILNVDKMLQNLLLVFAAVSLSGNSAALLNPSVTKELEMYSARTSLLYDMLKVECPEQALTNHVFKRSVLSEDDGSRLAMLDAEKKLFSHMAKLLAKCRQDEMSETKLSTTATPTTESPGASTTNTETTAAATVTELATNTSEPECPHANGYTKMSLDFVSYRNPSNATATGVKCDLENGTACQQYLEVCVSPVGERSCDIHHLVTDVVGDGSIIIFTSDIGGSANPLILDLGEQQWEGANILVTVWAKDINQKTDDLVDEFSYDTVDSPGSPSRNVNLRPSVQKQPKSSLALALRTYCPSLLTTTTTRPTTEPSPAPPACASALNFTESWRRDSAGSSLRPVNGRLNCDNSDMVSQGRPWFRFSGAAGNRLLDTCPPTWSCGTHLGLWSSDPMPAAVGVRAIINVSQSHWQNHPSKSCKPFPSYSQVSVMRCSTRQYDFIYRYDDSGTTCQRGFCGMN